MYITITQTVDIFDSNTLSDTKPQILKPKLGTTITPVTFIWESLLPSREFTFPDKTVGNALIY